MIEAVIIDFDDTLCLTEESCFGLENETLQRMGRAPMSREIHVQTWGQPLGDAIQLRSPGIDVDAFWQLMPSVHEEYIANGQIDIVTNENIEALDRLTKLGKKLMILTSRTKPEVRHLLDPSHHLAGRLTSFYHKDNTDFHKPDPRVFEVIERDHGLRPEQCVYVGDSPSDAVASNGAGLLFIANLESGLRQTSDFSQNRVDYFIHKFPDIVDAVQRLDAAK